MSGKNVNKHKKSCAYRCNMSQLSNSWLYPAQIQGLCARVAMVI